MRSSSSDPEGMESRLSNSGRFSSNDCGVFRGPKEVSPSGLSDFVKSEGAKVGEVCLRVESEDPLLMAGEEDRPLCFLVCSSVEVTAEVEGGPAVKGTGSEDGRIRDRVDGSCPACNALITSV